MRRKDGCRGLHRTGWPGGLEGGRELLDLQPPRSPSLEPDEGPGRLGKPGFGLLLSGPFCLRFSKVAQIQKIAQRFRRLAARFGPPSPLFKNTPRGSFDCIGRGGVASSSSPELDGRPGRRAGCAGSPAAEVSVGPAGRKAWRADGVRRISSCRGLRRWRWTKGLSGAQEALEG